MARNITRIINNLGSQFFYHQSFPSKFFLSYITYKDGHFCPTPHGGMLLDSLTILLMGCLISMPIRWLSAERGRARVSRTVFLRVEQDLKCEVRIDCSRQFLFFRSKTRAETGGILTINWSETSCATWSRRRGCNTNPWAARWSWVPLGEPQSNRRKNSLS